MNLWIYGYMNLYIYVRQSPISRVVIVLLQIYVFPVCPKWLALLVDHLIFMFLSGYFGFCLPPLLVPLPTSSPFLSRTTSSILSANNYTSWEAVLSYGSYHFTTVTYILQLSVCDVLTWFPDLFRCSSSWSENDMGYWFLSFTQTVTITTWTVRLATLRRRSCHILWFSSTGWFNVYVFWW